MAVLAFGLALACCLLRAADAAFAVPAGAAGRPPWDGGGREEEAAALRVGPCCTAALLAIRAAVPAGSSLPRSRRQGTASQLWPGIPWVLLVLRTVLQHVMLVLQHKTRQG